MDSGAITTGFCALGATVWLLGGSGLGGEEAMAGFGELLYAAFSGARRLRRLKVTAMGSALLISRSSLDSSLVFFAALVILGDN